MLGSEKSIEAVCKPDYDQRVEYSNRKEKEKQQRKKEADEAERSRRRALSRGFASGKKTIEPKDSSQEEDEQDQEIVVPKVGYFDIYGVWFFGKLKGIVRDIARTRFNFELQKMTHVYVDVEPKDLADGIHDITVYGHACRLYKWTAQGYHRGLVVLADDECGNAMACIYMKSGTWSWQLKDEDKTSFEQLFQATPPVEE